MAGHGMLPGTRLFIAAVALTAFFGAGHVAGVFVTTMNAAKVAGLQELFDAMRAFTVPGAAGIETSLWGLRQFFNFAFSILLGSQAMLGMLILRYAEGLGRGDLLRAAALVLCATMTAVTLLAVFFGVFQAILTGGLIAMLYAGSAWQLTRRSREG
jgi:hypothetical protein